MVIVFIAFGVLFGAVAAGFTLMSGGSILLAIAAYSGAGAVGALAITFLLLFFGNASNRSANWQDKQKSSTVSA